MIHTESVHCSNNIVILRIIYLYRCNEVWLIKHNIFFVVVWLNVTFAAGCAKIKRKNDNSFLSWNTQTGKHLKNKLIDNNKRKCGTKDGKK